MSAKRLALAAVVLAGLAPPALAREIVLSASGSTRRIVVLDAEGHRSTLMTERRAIDPSWSPDHERVAYQSAEGPGAYARVSIVSRAGGPVRRITGAGWVAPEWSPYGKWVAAACLAGAPCKRRPGLYLIDPRNPRVKRRLGHTVGAEKAAWAPRGRRLVFTAYKRGAIDLYVKRLGRPRVRRLTSTEIYELSPAWSPGGRWIAFTRPRSGDAGGGGELWIVRADGSKTRRLTRTRISEAWPSWSADGRRILFNTLNGLFSIRPDGSGRRKIEGTRAGDCCADW